MLVLSGPGVLETEVVVGFLFSVREPATSLGQPTGLPTPRHSQKCRFYAKMEERTLKGNRKSAGTREADLVIRKGSCC